MNLFSFLTFTDLAALLTAILLLNYNFNIEWAALTVAILNTAMAAWRFGTGEPINGTVDILSAILWAWLWWISRKDDKRKRIFALFGEKSRAMIRKLVRRMQEEGR